MLQWIHPIYWISFLRSHFVAVRLIERTICVPVPLVGFCFCLWFWLFFALVLFFCLVSFVFGCLLCFCCLFVLLLFVVSVFCCFTLAIWWSLTTTFMLVAYCSIISDFRETSDCASDRPSKRLSLKTKRESQPL